MRKDSKELRDAFIKKYAENHCRFTMTCNNIGVSSQVAREWRLTFPDFDEAITREERLLAEQVEGGLIDEALKDGGQIVAKIFYLKNNWEEKYGERQVIDVQPGQLWFEQKPAIQGEEVLPKLGTSETE